MAFIYDVTECEETEEGCDRQEYKKSQLTQSAHVAIDGRECWLEAATSRDPATNSASGTYGTERQFGKHLGSDYSQSVMFNATLANVRFAPKSEIG